MPFFDGAQGRIFYRHWPTNTTPTAALILLHGFGEHSGLYHRYAAELAAHGVELWALDQQGRGLSDGERGDVGSYDAVVHNARALTDLAAARSPELPLAISGHSLGSLGALFAALDQPSRYSSVVISGAPLSPLPWLSSVTEAGGSFELDLDALSGRSVLSRRVGQRSVGVHRSRCRRGLEGTLRTGVGASSTRNCRRCRHRSGSARFGRPDRTGDRRARLAGPTARTSRRDHRRRRARRAQRDGPPRGGRPRRPPRRRSRLTGANA